MTQDQISTILGVLERVEAKVDQKADKTDVARLEGKLDKTNGRVTRIEAEQIRDEATDAAKDGLKVAIWKAAAAIIASSASIAAVAFLIVDHA